MEGVPRLVLYGDPLGKKGFWVGRINIYINKLPKLGALPPGPPFRWGLRPHIPLFYEYHISKLTLPNLSNLGLVQTNCRLG